jgi:hypothetical protein
MSILQMMLGVGGGYVAKNSVLMTIAGAKKMSFTPATAGNRKTWTWSGWIKRTSISGNSGIFCSANTGGTPLSFYVSNTGAITAVILGVGTQTTSGTPMPSTGIWYHVHIVFDSTQATAANRCILTVNNVVYPFAANIVALNTDYGIGFTSEQIIGFDSWGSAYCDAYIAEVTYVNGAVVPVSSFGETAPSSAWIPKKYSGAFGTTGYYLDFIDGITITTVCNDHSGSGNNLTPTNMSLSDWTTVAPPSA